MPGTWTATCGLQVASANRDAVRYARIRLGQFRWIGLVSVGRVPGWHEMESVWWERSMNGQEERADRANDTAARVIAYLSPYLFWAMVGAIVGGILLLQA